MSLNTGLNTGVLLHLLALSAIIADLLRRLDHTLVAAAAQSQVDGRSGKLIILGIAQPVQADADTYGNRHLIANIYGFHILQKFETLLTHLGYRFLTQHRQILVLFNFLADSVETGNILVHFPVNQRHQQ